MTSPVVTRQVNPPPTCSNTLTPIYTGVDMSIYYPYKGNKKFKYKKKLSSRCPLCLSRLDSPECP